MDDPMQRAHGAVASPADDTERAPRERDPIRPDRRTFLARLAGAGAGVTAGALLGRAEVVRAAPASQSTPGLIDVHHHHLPPFWVEENRERITAGFGVMRSPWFTWTPERAVEAMDRSGVQLGILSVTSPGVWYGEAQPSRRAARLVNEYGADLVRRHPARFGLFAAIPLPDPEGSLREIEHAYGALKADGVGLLTSYDGRWLGDRSFTPVMEELDRRKAVVFVHPTVAPCCRGLLPDAPGVIAEIPQDTARAITNLLYTGTLARFPNIRFIFTHAGGNIATVYARIVQFPPKDVATNAPDGIDAALRRLHFDIAAAAYRPNIAALTSLVPASQILLGSDNPYIPLEDTVRGMKEVGFSERDLRAIGRENALRLFPRLRTA